MRTRIGKDDDAGTVDGHAAERMSERKGEATVEREWDVVVVKEEDGERRIRERLGRKWKMVRFLLAGDLRPLKLRGARSQNSEDILSGGLPIPTDPYDIRKKLPIDCVKFLLLPLTSLLAAQ